MPIRMESGGTAPRTYTFVQVPPNQSVFVQFLLPGQDIIGTPIHFLPKTRRSVPCLHEECAFHELDIRMQWFAPVMVWKEPTGPYPLHHHLTWDKGGWVNKVLRVTDHMSDVRNEDLRGWIVEVYRIDTYFNAPVAWKKIERVPELRQVPLEPFDVYPTLKKCWGKYAQMKKQYPPIGAPEASAAAATPAGLGSDQVADVGMGEMMRELDRIKAEALARGEPAEDFEFGEVVQRVLQRRQLATV